MTTTADQPDIRLGPQRGGGLGLGAPRTAAPRVDDEADEPPAIALRGLTKVYAPTPRWMRPMARTHIRSQVTALDGVDLTLRAGEICAIVGPNGAGKTTLFRIIVGLTTATSGSGQLLGLDVMRESERIRQVVGWMPTEDRSLLMRATCRENLHLHGRLQGMPRRTLPARIEQALETVGLTNQIDAVVAGLSAGMKARLRLARALLPGPRVLILDEPTGAVDPIAAHAPVGAGHGPGPAGAARRTDLLAPAGGDRGAALPRAAAGSRAGEVPRRPGQSAAGMGPTLAGAGLRRPGARPAAADRLAAAGLEFTVEGAAVRCDSGCPGWRG